MEFENDFKISGTCSALKPLDNNDYLGGSVQIKTYSWRNDSDVREVLIDVFFTKDDYAWLKANGIEELMPIVYEDKRRMVRANETLKKKYFNISLYCQVESWIPKNKNGSPNLKKQKKIYVCRELLSCEREKKSV